MMGGGEEAQVMNLCLEGINIAVRLSVQSIKGAVYLARLMHKSYQESQQKGLLTAKGKISLNKMMKITPELECQRINKDLAGEYEKLCKKFGVPIVKCAVLSNDDSKCVHYAYPRAAASRMEHILEIIRDMDVSMQMKKNPKVTKEQAKAKAEENNRVESQEEYMLDAGILDKDEIVEKKWLEKYPEDKKFFEKKEKKINLEKQKEIESAITNNDFIRKKKLNNVTVFSFSKKQMTGIETVQKGEKTEKFCRVKSPYNSEISVMVNLKNARMTPDDKIEVVLSNDDYIKVINEKTKNSDVMKVSEFISKYSGKATQQRESGHSATKDIVKGITKKEIKRS